MVEVVPEVHAVGVVIRTYGGMEAGCKRADMEVWRYGVPQP